MKKFTYSFRSIMINHVERVIPGTVFSRMVLEMDDSSIEKHTMELTVKDILNDKSWITGFLLSLIIVTPVTALFFAMFYVGFGNTMNHSSIYTAIAAFVMCGIIILIAFWIFISAKFSVENKKRNFVEASRGRGNWKIIDERKWDHFYRLLMVAKNKRESDKLIK